VRNERKEQNSPVDGGGREAGVEVDCHQRGIQKDNKQAMNAACCVEKHESLGGRPRAKSLPESQSHVDFVLVKHVRESDILRSRNQYESTWYAGHRQITT
jgi:hypothetical protein